MMTTEQLLNAIANGDTIEDADLSEVDWKDLSCAEAKFIRCRFMRCRFAHTDIRAASFEDCIFADKEASVGATFAFTEMHEAHLIRCDLSFCHFDRARLFDIHMERCNLLGARFTGADFSHSLGRKVVQFKASIRKCNLDVTNLVGIRLPQCDLSGSSFREADLTDADLSGANLQESMLEEAELLRADLSDADLRRAKFAGLDIRSLKRVKGMKISADHQWLLLAALGIEVDPD